MKSFWLSLGSFNIGSGLTAVLLGSNGWLALGMGIGCILGFLTVGDQ